MSLFPNAQCPMSIASTDPTAKFRKLLPPGKPIRRFSDLRTPIAEPPRVAPAIPSPSGVLLPVVLPCCLLRVICDQWDLYHFVVGDLVNSCNAKFAKRMPCIAAFLRAQARRICPETGDVLRVECSPEDLYALLFFCCGQSRCLDPVRDVIEPALSAWEALVADQSDSAMPLVIRPPEESGESLQQPQAEK